MYSDEIVQYARSVRRQRGLSYPKVAEQIEHKFGVQVPWRTVADWIVQATRITAGDKYLRDWERDIAAEREARRSFQEREKRRAQEKAEKQREEMDKRAQLRREIAAMEWRA